LKPLKRSKITTVQNAMLLSATYASTLRSNSPFLTYLNTTRRNVNPGVAFNISVDLELSSMGPHLLENEGPT
jgi:hypothetical protein